MTSAYQSNIEYSRSLQEKYEYYLIALNFTILALSIQTAAFGGGKIETGLELAGWLALLLGGVVALLRLEAQPSAYRGYAEIQAQEDQLSELKDYQLKVTTEKIRLDLGDEPIQIKEAISHKEDWVLRNQPKVESLKAKIIAYYQVHKILFILGIFLIALSRGYRPFLSLLG